jgi:uncharacterized 2Fe-2S/4Fe-4S cluster protein (DUF4445 family)
MATVTLDGVCGPARLGQTLFEWSEAHGVEVPTSCHKQGRCRECLVEIEAGGELLSARSTQERHLPDRFRLACRTHLEVAGEVRAHTLRRGTLRIETAAAAPVDDGKRPDAAVTRHGRSVLIDGAPVAEADGPLHGIALDLGTTTVALRLYDLETGRLIATQAFENPQRFGGSDVLARIHYDGAHPGRLLQRVLLGYLARSIAALPVDPSTLYEIVVAGNPTMRDLLFGLDVQSLGVLPFQSVSERTGRGAGTGRVASARSLRLPMHPAARVVGLPLIGSHVGADAAACLLASGLAQGEPVGALLDIGTNTEVLLGNRTRLLAASCPAGPAFEGGGVRCGMPALDGAVERVRVHGDGRIELTTIGGTAPAGLCGSALVDLLAELLRSGQMSTQGRFADDAPTVVLDASSGLDFSEQDVNELAQAKGANAAGLSVLADAYGLEWRDLDRLYLAGGFARHLDVEAAVRIGLVPDLPRERIVKLGNASLAGASLALLSRRRRAWLAAAVQRVELVRLESHPRFFDYFVQGCQFAPLGSES